MNLRNVTLFKEEEGELTSDVKFVMLKLQDIFLPASQPRKYFSPEAMDSLVASIEVEGILQPVLVRPLDVGYELVAGERRYRAAQMLGMEELPAIIRTLDDKEAKVISLTENLQREDLNPVEETEGILALLEIELGLDQEAVKSLLNRFDHETRKNVEREESAHNVMGKEKIEEIFSRLSITWRSFLKNRIPLLNLPENVLDALRQGKLEYTKAKAIAKVKDEEAGGQLLEEAIAQNLSLTQIRARVNELTAKVQEDSSVLQITPQREMTDIYHRLKKSEVWKKDPKRWKKVQGLLKKIEFLLEEESLQIERSEDDESTSHSEG
jgi:ParB family chromosome partitioning protein